MSSPKALQAKDIESKLFKDGKLLEPVRMYTEAEKFDPASALFPSNRSAALYELGDYPVVLAAILHLASLNPEPGLAFQLSARLVKTLSHGIQDGSIDPIWVLEEHRPPIKKLDEVAIEDDPKNGQAWRMWRAIRSALNHRSAMSHEAKLRLSKTPMFKGTWLTYYMFDMDEIISMVDDWGLEYKNLIKLRTMSKEQLSQISFLIADVGDGNRKLQNQHAALLLRARTHADRITAMESVNAATFGYMGNPHVIECAGATRLIENLTDSQVKETAESLGIPNATAAQTRTIVKEHEEMLIMELLALIRALSMDWRNEAAGVRLKVFMPPPKLSGKHVGFEFFSKISQGRALESLLKPIRQIWKLNITIMNGTESDYPSSDLDATETYSKSELSTENTDFLSVTIPLRERLRHSPGKSDTRPKLVKLPNNLVAFIGLLVELRNIGYPSHWLGGFLSNNLSDSIIRSGCL
ncbi:hypothetical protein BDQ12DRAFT_724006 [Crucibulum laeve]|uniref:Uncharacterized protein n=1 Tax=Crucibulum laeve TaxID=68775 RepID=A0A5C3LYR5_9AGAR|nr:hypothetical protein BDQ12DRAFT_724006 [Crucibulum laeve]